MNPRSVSEVSKTPTPADRERFVTNAMRDLKLSQFRALALLSEHPTVDRAAREANERYSSIKAQLLALDKWFNANLSVHLISRHHNNQYELTPAGSAVAAHVAKIEIVLRDMIDASGSPQVRVNIPCTSDCLESFAQVRDMIEKEAADAEDRLMEVAIHAVASADFDPFDPKRPVAPVLSFGSLYCRGPRLDLTPNVDYMVLDERPIVAITNDPSISWPEETTVPELLALKPRILMPTGGVVWQFMNDFSGSPSWRLTNGAHMPVHDLHFGLRALATKAEPRAVMLVHGIEDGLAAHEERYPMLEDISVIRFSESHDGGPRAVTGLFYSRQASARRVPDFAEACDRFWSAAQRTLPHRYVVERKDSVE